MDTTDSRITFDAKGVCDHCRNFYERTLKPSWDTDEKGWEQLARTATGSARRGRGATSTASSA
jgi:hypothetical protein